PKEPEFSISETVEPTLTGYELSEGNLLVLDMAKYRINNGAWQDKKDVLIIDRQIRDALHIDRRGGEKLQPWYIEKYIETPDKGMAEFIFEFGIEEMPKEDIFLCMEEPKSFELEVNGNHVDTDTYEGEYIDIAFKRIRIRKELLLKGNNIIETKTKYNFKTNLEPMYLTGNFGVRTEKNYCVIINLPEKLEIGDITGQGLPFYGGRVRYFFDIPASSKLLVEVENIDAALLVINPDKDNKAIISKPYIIDTTGNDGKLVIDAVLTRRNTFGPYHIYPAKQWGCQPQSFYTTGDAYKDEFVSMPMGLLSSPKVHIC
ncbi:MAG: hypothetical protein Q8882_01315, partial [Bacillota bacterium]|nr:hypothetical protein [Bacillota bacterium]